jgi:hypothetical protein
VAGGAFQIQKGGEYSGLQMKLLLKIVLTGSLVVLVSPAVFAQGAKKPPQPQRTIITDPDGTGRVPRKGMKPPSGAGFYIAPVDESPSTFSVLLTDGAGNSVAGTFTRQQIDVFEAVLDSAKVFALNDEKVGSTAPITTRLMEQHEWSLFVDVSKIGDKSRFYISLITPQGRLTTPAGEVTRGSKKEHSALLLDMLEQIRNIQAGGKPVQ